MHRLLRILFGCVVLVVVAAAAVGAVVAFGYDRPTVENVESHVVDVNTTTTLVETDVSISNPNPIGIRLGDATLTHSVEMNGVEMGANTEHGLRIGRKTTNVTLTTAIDNRKIPTWWGRHIENGERTRVETSLGVSVPVLGRIATNTETTTFRTNVTDRLSSSTPRPVNADRPLLSDPVLVINRTSATWGEVTHNATPLDTEITVYNPSPVRFELTRLEYTVTMNDVVVGNGTTGETVALPAGERRTITAETVIRNDRLDDWWKTHIQRDQRTDLRVAFTGVVSLPNGDTVRVPLRGLDYTATIRTHVFETSGSAGELERREPYGSAAKSEHKSATVAKRIS